jgi:hypothetical protein
VARGQVDVAVPPSGVATVPSAVEPDASGRNMVVVVLGVPGSDAPLDLPTKTATPKGYEQVPVTTGGVASLTVPAGSKVAIIDGTTDVRWRDDGTNPTAALGKRLVVGAELAYDGALAAIRFIAVSAAGVLDVAYYA